MRTRLDPENNVVASNPFDSEAIEGSRLFRSVIPVAHLVAIGPLAQEALNNWHAITLDTSCIFPLGVEAPSGVFYFLMPLLKTVHGCDFISVKRPFIHPYSGRSFKNVAAIKS